MNNDRMTIHQVVKNHREGCALVGSGNLRGAIISFKVALNCISAVVPAFNIDQADLSYNNNNNNFDPSMVHDVVSRSDVRTMMMMAFTAPLSKETSDRDENFFMFRRAIYFPESALLLLTEQQDDDWSHTLFLLSGVILFNLGLCYHGLAQETNTNGFLQTASTLYSLCVKLTQKRSQLIPYSNSLATLSVLAMNNQAQAFVSNGNYRHAVILLDTFKPVWIEQSLYMSQLLDPSDVFGIFLNMISLQNPPGAAPTA